MSSVPLSVLAALMPWPLKRWIYVHLFHWDIAPSARVGLSVIQGGHVRLGHGARIGHGNIVKGVGHFELGNGAFVKNFNEILASEAPGFPNRSLVIGEGSLVMSHHFFDVAGEIVIGDGCTIGGRGSQFWSHSLVTEDTGSKVLTAKRLVIGDDVYVGAGATLVHGTIPDRCVVGAGAVSGTHFADTDFLIRGNPAVATPLKHAPRIRE